MGLLRLMLAFAVVIAHTRPVFGFQSIGSDAVPAFFIISGFYMHLALTSQYERQGGVLDFYSNRIIRVVPMYWAALIMAFVVSTIVAAPGTFLDRISVSAYNSFHRAVSGDDGALVAAIPNLAILGGDIVRLFCVSSTTGHVVVQHHASTSACREIADYLILPQVWSLSAEVIFYALSPLLVRIRTARFLPLVLVLIALKHRQSYSDLYWKHLPFTYNFGFFALGMLACRAYRQSEPAFHRLRFVLSPFPFVVWALFPQLIRGASPIDEWSIWTVYAFSLPCLFTLSRSSRFDRAIAELSYPVYLVHWLFAWPATMYGPSSAFVTMGCSVLASCLLLVLVEAPLGRIRRKIRSGSPRHRSAPPAGAAEPLLWSPACPSPGLGGDRDVVKSPRRARPLSRSEGWS